MNSSKQAQQGFKTFILTLVISLVVFSAIYYVVNADVDNSANTYVSDSEVIDTKTDDATAATLGASSERELAAYPSPDDMKKKEEKSVFEELATEDVFLGAPQVLAETDANPVETTPVAETAPTSAEVPESTVPVTGFSNPTIGIIFSLISLLIFSYVMFVGPRKLALTRFEKKILDDLD